MSSVGQGGWRSRRVRRGLFGALLALVVVGAWRAEAQRRGGRPASSWGRRGSATRRPREERSSHRRQLAGANRIVAHGAQIGAGAGTDPGASGAPANGAPAPDAGALPVATAAPPGAVLGAAFALAPGAVRDDITGHAPSPLLRPRSEVVGRVGPYGVRDGWAPGGLGWVGMASLRRDDGSHAAATDDTQDPVTTAVHGVVVAEDGSPIRDAQVILYSSFYLRQAYYDHRVRQLGRVLTDASGAFDLRPVDLDTVHFGADGEIFVTVRHPSYPDLVAQVLPGIVPGQESDVGRLVLPARGATIRGVVLDLEGRPVAGAVVRVSGAMNPVDYDKTERLVVLDACPSATTDAEGRYLLADFAGGVHEVSIHIRLDCVVHGSERWEGDREWSPRVQAGNQVRGRVVDPEGAPVAAAVVFGGGNWTPTNPDGTFWLDNVLAGPLTLEVAHAAWHTVVVPGVATNGDDIVVAERERLPARDADGARRRRRSRCPSSRSTGRGPPAGARDASRPTRATGTNRTASSPWWCRRGPSAPSSPTPRGRHGLSPPPTCSTARTRASCSSSPRGGDARGEFGGGSRTGANVSRREALQAT